MSFDTVSAAGAALTLKYVFTPSPNPIRASTGGANPNTIDLEIMISNPTLDPVTMQSITIEIPVGENSARSLSPKSSLPGPVPATSGIWSITSSGSTITIETSDGSPGTISDNLIFNLKDITVNDTAGVVPITITEINPPAPKVSDDETYSLVKRVADFPITNFYADPAILYDLDQPVTLYWKCSDQGGDYSYSLHSDSWQPRDCLNAGNCFTCQDGTNGVTSPQLAETTTFALDVIATDSSGNRFIHATLYTVVQLLQPSISQDSFQTQYISGQVVTLYWRSYNAAKCTVNLDDLEIDSNAPTDTYLTGYPVELSGKTGTHQLTVAAHAQQGSARATWAFPNVDVTPATTIPLSATSQPVGVAVTPDGALAVVANSGKENNVYFIDIGQRQAEQATVPIGSQPYFVAITPNGKFAFVTCSNANTVYVIDIEKRALDGNPITVGNAPWGIAITPDGKEALVTTSQGLYIIDVASRTVVAQQIYAGTWPTLIAVTPDGTVALISDRNDSVVTVIDIAKRAPEPNRIPAGTGPDGIAITPDGALAFVCNTRDNNVTVIDIGNRQAEASKISVGNHPLGITISPDGAIGFVVNDEGASLTLINIATRETVSQTVPVIEGPLYLGFTPDGRNAVVTSFADTGYNGKVTVL